MLTLSTTDQQDGLREYEVRFRILPTCTKWEHFFPKNDGVTAISKEQERFAKFDSLEREEGKGIGFSFFMIQVET